MRIAALYNTKIRSEKPAHGRADASDAIVFARLVGDVAHLFDRAPWLSGRETGESRAWSSEDLACPVVPSKIVCIGRNYALHAKELGNEVPKEPLLFLKPPSALIGPGAAIVLPKESERVEHEAELGVVISKRAKNVSVENALDFVFGYTCVGDITARDIQRKDVQFTRGKGFDTFCPVGPWIETDGSPDEFHIDAHVNGTLRQSGDTKDMVFNVKALIAYVSRMMTLEPGDLIVTGTPEGVGPLLDGDVLSITIRDAGAHTGANAGGGAPRELGTLTTHVRNA